MILLKFWNGICTPGNHVLFQLFYGNWKWSKRLGKRMKLDDSGPPPRPKPCADTVKYVTHAGNVSLFEDTQMFQEMRWTLKWEDSVTLSEERCVWRCWSTLMGDGPVRHTNSLCPRNSWLWQPGVKFFRKHSRDQHRQRQAGKWRRKEERKWCHARTILLQL